MLLHNAASSICFHLIMQPCIGNYYYPWGATFMWIFFCVAHFFALHIFGVAHFFASHIFCVAHFFPLHNFCVPQFLRSTFFASTFLYFWDSVTSSRRFFSRKMLGIADILLLLRFAESGFLTPIIVAYSPIHNFVYKSRI